MKAVTLVRGLVTRAQGNLYLSTEKTLFYTLLAICISYSVVRLWIFHTLPQDHFFPMYDSIMYMETAKLSLLNPYFYPHKPFFYSFFVKILGRNIMAILIVQNILSIAAWFFLGNCIRKQMKNVYLGWLSLFIILAYSCAAYLTIWDVKVMTESVSISLLVTFIGLYLIVLNSQFKSKLVWCLIAVGFMLATIRDTNAYFLLLIGIMTLALSFYLRRSSLTINKKGMYLFLGGVLVAFFASYITQSYRYPESLCGTLTTRVGNYPGASAYLYPRGFPYLKLNPLGCVDSVDAVHWLQKHGKSIYASFLITHPNYTFNEYGFNNPTFWHIVMRGQKEMYSDITHKPQYILNLDGPSYPRSHYIPYSQMPDNEFSMAVNSIVWAGVPFLFALALAVYLFNFSRNKSDMIINISIFLLITAIFVLSFLTWHADTGVADLRHQLGNNIQIIIALALLIFKSLDNSMELCSKFLNIRFRYRET